MTDLFPKPPRHLRQPTKRVLRAQLALAADALIAERERADYWQRVAAYRYDGWDQHCRIGAATVEPISPEAFAALNLQFSVPMVREPNPITALLQRLFRRAA